MKFYVAFDDTDTLDCGRGTGKLARWFTEKLPKGCTSHGVVRQQLLHHESIPMTSHNSSLCCIIETPGIDIMDQLIEDATEHIKENFFEGSDPGLCIAPLRSVENNNNLLNYAISCVSKKVSQKDALDACKGFHLSGHGGTNDGIIGAAAAIGLTLHGNSGRFVDYKSIRDVPQVTTVQNLHNMGIHVMSANRHAEFPSPEDTVDTKNSLRPRLWRNEPVLPVLAIGSNEWQVIDEKKKYT